MWENDKWLHSPQNRHLNKIYKFLETNKQKEKKNNQTTNIYLFFLKSDIPIMSSDWISVKNFPKKKSPEHSSFIDKF